MTTVAIRMDDALKAEAEELFADWGMNMTTAITCFVKKCVDTGVMPFTIGRSKLKHAQLVKALEEAKAIARDPNAPTCDDPDKIEEFMLG